MFGDVSFRQAPETSNQTFEQYNHHVPSVTPSQSRSNPCKPPPLLPSLNPRQCSSTSYDVESAHHRQTSRRSVKSNNAGNSSSVTCDGTTNRQTSHSSYVKECSLADSGISVHQLLFSHRSDSNLLKNNSTGLAPVDPRNAGSGEVIVNQQPAPQCRSRSVETTHRQRLVEATTKTATSKLQAVSSGVNQTQSKGPPISSARLVPIRQKLKNAVVSKAWYFHRSFTSDHMPLKNFHCELLFLHGQRSNFAWSTRIQSIKHCMASSRWPCHL